MNELYGLCSDRGRHRRLVRIGKMSYKAIECELLACIRSREMSPIHGAEKIKHDQPCESTISFTTHVDLFPGYSRKWLRRTSFESSPLTLSLERNKSGNAV